MHTKNEDVASRHSRVAGFNRHTNRCFQKDNLPRIAVSNDMFIHLAGHNNIVRCIIHSPTGPAFVTCSDDYRARFWYRKAETD